MSVSPIADVGIPTHGRPAFVAEAIESVCAQTCTSWRLRISEDGGPTDAVRAVVDHYLSDPRISYEPAGEALGASRNMSRLVAMGSAPYVALLHDDDRWAPDWLARRVEFMEAHPECGFVFAPNLEIDGHGKPKARIPAKLEPGLHAPEAFVPSLLRSNPIGTPSVLVRRAAYEAVGGSFDHRFSAIYDYELFLRLASRFPTGYLLAWDSDYRVHGPQSSFDVRTRRADEFLRFLDHVHELLADRPELLPEPGALRRRRAHFLLSRAVDAAQENERADAWRDLRAAVQADHSLATDTRTMAALAALAAGRRGGEALARVRYFVRSRRIRVHLSREHR